jgi:hypothetical protein
MTPTRRVGKQSRAASRSRAGGRRYQLPISRPCSSRRMRRSRGGGGRATPISNRRRWRGRWCAHRALYFFSIHNTFRRLLPFILLDSRNTIIFSTYPTYCVLAMFVSVRTVLFSIAAPLSAVEAICLINEPESQHTSRPTGRRRLRLSPVLLILENVRAVTLS